MMEDDYDIKCIVLNVKTSKINPKWKKKIHLDDFMSFIKKRKKKSVFSVQFIVFSRNSFRNSKSEEKK